MKYWKSVWQWGQDRFDIFAVMSRCEKDISCPLLQLCQDWDGWTPELRKELKVINSSGVALRAMIRPREAGVLFSACFFLRGICIIM